jgi:hypothetical protein
VIRIATMLDLTLMMQLQASRHRANQQFKDDSMNRPHLTEKPYLPMGPSFSTLLAPGPQPATGVGIDMNPVTKSKGQALEANRCLGDLVLHCFGDLGARRLPHKQIRGSGTSLAADRTGS